VDIAGRVGTGVKGTAVLGYIDLIPVKCHFIPLLGGSCEA
jgi:hypothetical protein